VECARHALAKISVPLGTRRRILAEPLFHEMFVATFVANLDGHGTITLELSCQGQGMFGHPAVEPCGSIRTEGRDEAGLGLSCVRIAGKNDEAITTRV